MDKYASSLMLTLLLSTACGAHIETAARVRYAALVATPQVGRHLFERPAIIEFEPGDRLPVELVFDDPWFALDPAPPRISLVAKRHCYVRIDRHGLRVSGHDDDFDVAPRTLGSFRANFAHHPTGPVFDVRVRTPRR